MCRPAAHVRRLQAACVQRPKKLRGRISAVVQLKILNEKFKFVNVHKTFAVLSVGFWERHKYLSADLKLLLFTFYLQKLHFVHRHKEFVR